MSTGKRLNVLVTGAGTVTAGNVIKALNDAGGFRVISTDINKREFVAYAYFSDKFYRVPRGDDKRYIARLIWIVKKEKVDVLIPIVDEELMPVSKSKKRFKGLGAAVVISGPKAIELCADKYKTYRFLNKHGFFTAPTYLPAQRHRLRRSDFPMMLKPRSGKGSVGLYKVFDSGGLTSLLRREKNVVIQKFISGPEYTVDTFSDKRGNLRVAVPRLRIETKAGVSYKGETVSDRCLIKAAARIVKLFGIIGPANIQCIKTKGRFCFIEVNPRFSGGLALTVKAGVNTPLMAVDLALGRQIRGAADFKAGLKMVRYVREIFF
ncbi:ATP-grasp domain-containing protein [Candidatus Omnitrophota bacterium]